MITLRQLHYTSTYTVYKASKIWKDLMDVFFLDFSVKEVTNRIRIEITYRIQIHKRFLGSKKPQKNRSTHFKLIYSIHNRTYNSNSIKTLQLKCNICLSSQSKRISTINFDAEMSRSSLPEVFFGKGVLKICSKFTRGHPCRSVTSIKLQSTLQICNSHFGMGVKL